MVLVSLSSSSSSQGKLANTSRRPNLTFQFNRHAVCRVQTHGLFRIRDGPMCMAYLDITAYAELRDTARFRTIRQAHCPSVRRSMKCIKARKPKDAIKDPYVAAVLIALAQERRLYEKPSEEYATLPTDGLSKGYKVRPVRLS